MQVAVRWEFLSWLTAGGLALAASPVLLAGPVLVLERRGPVQAVGRAYRLAVEGTWPDVIALLTGAVLVPALAVRAALWALDAVPAPLAITFTAALAVTVLPFQASVLTRAYLQRLAWRHTALQDSAVFPETVALKDIPSCQNGHPEPAGTWLWRLVAAVLLPAVLYAMTATANLLDRPELHQRPVTAVSDPAAAHLTGDGRLLLLLDDLDTPPTLLACTDPACTDTATVYAGPAGEDLWRDVASAPPCPAAGCCWPRGPPPTAAPGGSTCCCATRRAAPGRGARRGGCRRGRTSSRWRWPLGPAAAGWCWRTRANRAPGSRGSRRWRSPPVRTWPAPRRSPGRRRC
ncbi:hypothetical protein GCM10020001_108190 [Nonomuraea salmonea]